MASTKLDRGGVFPSAAFTCLRDAPFSTYYILEGKGVHYWRLGQVKRAEGLSIYPCYPVFSVLYGI